MAVAAAALLAAGSGTDATSFNPAGSITATSNALVLAVVENAFVGTPDTVTLTGGGLTWTQIRSDLYDTSGTQYRLTLYRAMAVAPGSATVTATADAAQTSAGWNIKIIELTGVQTSGSNGSEAIARTDFALLGASNTTLTTTMTDSGPWDATVGFVAHQAVEDITVGSGFALVGAKASHSGPSSSVDTEFVASKDLTVDASWVTSSLAGMHAIGVLAAYRTGAVMVGPSQAAQRATGW